MFGRPRPETNFWQRSFKLRRIFDLPSTDWSHIKRSVIKPYIKWSERLQFPYSPEFPNSIINQNRSWVFGPAEGRWYLIWTMTVWLSAREHPKFFMFFQISPCPPQLEKNVMLKILQVRCCFCLAVQNNQKWRWKLLNVLRNFLYNMFLRQENTGNIKHFCTEILLARHGLVC